MGRGAWRERYYSRCTLAFLMEPSFDTNQQVLRLVVDRNAVETTVSLGDVRGDAVQHVV